MQKKDKRSTLASTCVYLCMDQQLRNIKRSNTQHATVSHEAFSLKKFKCICKIHAS